jgi:hypothetical protein
MAHAIQFMVDRHLKFQPHCLYDDVAAAITRTERHTLFSGDCV